MPKARLEIALGPHFSETRTLTWKHDGLIILPTANARLPTVRTASHAQSSYTHQIITNVPYHLLWFTAYCNDNTSFLDTIGDRELLVKNVIYTITNFSHKMNRNAFGRYYIQMLATGLADD